MNQAELAAIVDAQSQSQNALTQMAVNAAGQSARDFTGWYDSAQIGPWASQLASLIESIQGQTAASTDAYLTEVLAGLKGSPVSPSGTIDVTGLRKGVSHTEVYGRAADTYRYEVSQGKSESEALKSAVKRAEVLAETDVQLAQRDQSQRFMTSKKVNGYRRIIHPELSKGGTCGLCIAASDRIYVASDLMPIHARCGCTTAPILGAQDPGHELNRSDLNALYEQAGGSTSAADLKKVRYTVHDNGEIGPVLGVEGQAFRGPDDLPLAA